MNNVIIAISTKESAAHRLTRAEAKAETQRRVLEAAEAAFRRDGYHGASLARIAEEAGFTTGAVYSAFGSKAEMMLALLAARAAKRRTGWSGMADAAASAEEFSTELARRSAREVAAERDWLAALTEFMIVVGRDEELRARHADIRNANLTALAASIRTALDREEARWRIPPRELATVLTALFRGLIVEGMVAPAEVSEELLVKASQTLLRGARAGDPGTAGR